MIKMGEPLRDKGYGNAKRPVMMEFLDEGFLYKEIDIKSAVEWLKEHLPKWLKSEDNLEGCCEILDIIDKAFPDLNTKNSNKARKE